MLNQGKYILISCRGPRNLRPAGINPRLTRSLTTKSKHEISRNERYTTKSKTKPAAKIQTKPHQSKLGSLMDGILSNSLNNISDLLVRQASPSLDETSGGSQVHPIHSQQNNTHTLQRELPHHIYKKKFMTLSMYEPLDLLRPRDVKWILRHGSSAKSFTEYFCHSKDRHSHDIVCLLRLYLEKFENSGISDHLSQQIVSILLRYEWFYSASVIISRMHLALDDFLRYIDTILDTEPIFKGSPFMKFLFLVHLSKVLALKNSLVMSQLDYLQLNDGYNLCKLEFINKLLDTQEEKHMSISKIETQCRLFYKLYNDNQSDPEIEAFVTLIAANIAKRSHPMDPMAQASMANRILRNYTKKYHTNNFIGFFSIQFLKLDEDELMLTPKTSYEATHQFVSTRMCEYFHILCRDLNSLSPSTIDYFNFVRCIPASSQMWEIYKVYSFKGSRNTVDPFYTPLLTNMMCSTIGDGYIFVKNEFTRFSQNKKVDILIRRFEEFISAEKAGDDSCFRYYSHFMSLLNTITDQKEMMIVMKHIVDHFFNVRTNLTSKYQYKLLKMLSKVSKAQKLPNSCSKVASNYMIRYLDHEDHENYEEILKNCISICTKCSKVNNIYFIPALIRVAQRCELDEETFKPVALLISNMLNKLLDNSVIDATKMEVDADIIKNYSSNVLLKNKELICNCFTELLRSDISYFQYCFRERLKHISSTGSPQTKTSFSRKISYEQIILYSGVRAYLSTRPRINKEGCNLGMDQRTFEWVQSLLDSVTKRLEIQGRKKVDLDSRISATMGQNEIIEGPTPLNKIVDSLLDSKDSDTDKNEPESKYDNADAEEVYSTLMENIKDLELQHPERREEDTEKDDGVRELDPTKLNNQEKMERARLFVPLMLESMMIEEYVMEEPNSVDELVEKYYKDFHGDIPLTLLHSMMLGVLKSNDVPFEDKINKFKNLEKLAALIYDTDKDSNFRRYVRYKSVHVALINAIIDESSRINGGSLDTLSWAFKKFVNTPDVAKYSPWMKQWMKRLRVMKEQGSGFWNTGPRKLEFGQE